MAETKLSFYKLSFHVINSKNLPGEFYATTAPGF